VAQDSDQAQGKELGEEGKREMTVINIEEWKREKRRRDLRETQAEIRPNREAIAKTEEWINRLASLLDAGEITPDDCERLLEKWEREEGPLWRPAC
jgi:hypothetical protein